MQRMLKRRLFTAGVLAVPFARPAFAQAWAPSAPIRMIVAYPAGGPTDVIARIVAADISGPLGQQVIVENLSDLVIWDNRTTMHRVRRFDDLNIVRDVRRTTTKSDGPTAA